MKTNLDLQELMMVHDMSVNCNDWQSMEVMKAVLLYIYYNQMDITDDFEIETFYNQIMVDGSYEAMIKKLEKTAQYKSLMRSIEKDMNAKLNRFDLTDLADVDMSAIMSQLAETQG